MYALEHTHHYLFSIIRWTMLWRMLVVFSFSLAQITLFCSDLIKIYIHINHLERRGTRRTRLVRPFAVLLKSPVPILKYSTTLTPPGFRMWSTTVVCGKHMRGWYLCSGSVHVLAGKKPLTLSWLLRQSCFWPCLLWEMSKKNNKKNRKLGWVW